MEVIFSIIIILLFYAYRYISNYKVFKKSKYKEVSGNNFKETLHNKGNYGEFEIFHSLEKINAHIKILSNLYIPKEDGTFTEVDLVLLSRTGIYVIESKNYKGNISGDENDRYWAQSFRTRKKYKFYNPILQNNGHIKAIKSLLKIEDPDIFKSYIVFGNDCNLENVNISSEDIKIVKRYYLYNEIEKEIKESEKKVSVEELYRYYNKLLAFIHADDNIKRIHKDSIENFKH